MTDEATHIDQGRDSFEQLADEQRRIAEIGRIVSSSLDISDVYPRFAEHARALVRADRMVIAILSDDQTELVDQYIEGADIPGSAVGTRRKIDDNPARDSLMSDPSPVVFAGVNIKEFNTGDPEEDVRRQTGLQSLMLVPLFWQGSQFGVIAFRAFA
jgi:transcriptional regulator with GAF, ATPase, and Fis domain